MRMRTPLRVNVTRHEEKEQKLQEFLSQHVAAQNHGGDSPRSTHLLVVARSLESPVVRAVVSLADEISAAGLAVRIILAHIDRDALLDDWGRSVAFMHEVRWARHPRLIEAHEQLVIDAETCWIGDCMRRDPTKCDAYESFVEGCGEAAGCAAVSFERLWTTCQPLVSRTAGRGMDAMGPGALPPADGASQATVGTRH
jgi:hypothetical protein